MHSVIFMWGAGWGEVKNLGSHQFSNQALGETLAGLGLAGLAWAGLGWAWLG